MTQLRVQFDATRASRRLASVRAGAADLTAYHAVVANRLRNDTMRNFRSGGWWPGPWRPSRRASGMERGKTLMRTGTLRNGIRADHGRDYAAVGTSVPYAGVHQFGAVIPARTVRPRNARALRWFAGGRPVFAASARIPATRIPARPFLPVRDGRLHPTTIAHNRRALRAHLRLEN